MSANLKLSPEMQRALNHAMESEGAKLVRLPGGYWTHAGAKMNGSSPEWWCGTTTIEALVKRGKLTYSAWQERRNNRGRFPVEASVTGANP